MPTPTESRCSYLRNEVWYSQGGAIEQTERCTRGCNFIHVTPIIKCHFSWEKFKDLSSVSHYSAHSRQSAMSLDTLGTSSENSKSVKQYKTLIFFCHLTFW